MNTPLLTKCSLDREREREREREVFTRILPQNHPIANIASN